MSLIDEYAENKENRIIMNLLKSGMTAEVVAKSTKMPLPRVKSIERSMNK